MGHSVTTELTLEAIRGAHRRIADMIHRTPVMTSASIDERLGASVFFKCENLQKTGAFKARGATNAVFELGRAQAAHGVVTHSSGNHAAALARAARLRAIPAHIVMPRNAPRSKQDSVRRYGGQIVLCEPTLAARESTAAALKETTGAHLVHPYNDLSVMAGQGTTAIELMEQVPDLDAIICPVGGGGHLAGISVAAKSLAPHILVIGAEPAGADDAARSFKAGRIFPQLDPRSIADGLLSSLGDLSFAHIQAHVDEIVTVSEEQIIASMRLIWEILKIIVEPSGAVGFAAAEQIAVLRPRGRIGIVLTGGNLDLNHLPWQREKA